MRRWLMVLTSVAVVAGVLGAAPPTATGATGVAARMTVTTQNTRDWFLRTGEWDERNAEQTVIATGGELNVTLTGGTGSQTLSLRVTLDRGQRFQLGRTYPARSGLSADLWFLNRSSCALTWFDIRDVAYAGDSISRLDLRFQVNCPDLLLGDLQLGTPSTSAASGVRSLTWPDTPIGTHHPLTLPVWIRNFGAAPLPLGPATLTGSQAAEFEVSADRCSARTLHAAEACLIEIRFAPRTPGPKQSALIVAAGPATVQVDLAGTAPSGRTSFAVRSGPGNYLANGHDRLLSEVYAQAYATGSPSSVEFDIQASGYPSWSLWLRTPDRKPLKLGLQRYGYAPDEPSLPELSLRGEGRACGAPRGSFDLKQLSFDADGSVQRFSVSIRQECTDDPVLLTADIAYRATDAPPVPAGSFVLRNGQSLGSGGSLRNTDGYAYDQRLSLGTNGRAVITDANGRRLWASPNSGFSRSYRLGVLADGSVAITDRSGRAVWRKAPAGIRPGDFLLLQSDGNLVLYTPDYHPLWSALPI